VKKYELINLSVKGIAFEFLALNLTGFLFLSAYSSAGYFKKD
jgi:cystinosin